MSEKITLSDNIVDATLAGGFAISREKYRAIKGFNRAQMTRYLAEFYKIGVIDGINIVQDAVEENAESAKESAATPGESEPDEIRVDWDDVLDLIRDIKGVGEKTVEKIDRKLREVMG